MPIGRRWGIALTAPVRGAGLLLPDKRVWKRSNPILFAIAASVWICVAAKADSLPNLADTILYKKLAHNCRRVDLKAWNHPTKQVLRKYQVPLYAIELCNSDKYPIFHVDLKYDLLGPTDTFFRPFFNAMFDANGRNPMAFVERTSANRIVMISKDYGKPGECVISHPGRWCASFEDYNP